MLAALPLLLTLASEAAIAIEPQPPPCASSPAYIEVPEEGIYLFPGNVDRLVPANTSAWLRERAGFHHSYALRDETSNNTPIPIEVIRTGLLDGALVQIKPFSDLTLNHRIELLRNGDPIASFTPNVTADTIAPPSQTVFFESGRDSLQGPCFVPGFQVTISAGFHEPTIVLVEDEAEVIAAGAGAAFYVAAPEESMFELSVTLLDLAGNRSTRSMTQIVVAQQRTTGAVPLSRNRPTGFLGGCSCAKRAQTGAPALGLVALGLAFAFARRRV